MTHDEIKELLGAYALDAVDPDERTEVEAHLPGCEDCRDEVREHLEVASHLSPALLEPPAALWESISSAISQDAGANGRSQAPAAVVGIEAARGTRDGRTRDAVRAERFRSLRRAGLGAVAAVAAVLLVLMSVQISHLNSQVHQFRNAATARPLAPAVAAAYQVPHRQVTLTSATSGATAKILITDTGQAYWLASTLPKLSAGRIYQLWALVGGRPVSIGLISRPHAYAAFTVGRAARTIMLTNEPAGGTPQPTTAVLAQGTLS
jgi:hypothetical protein